MMLAIGRYHIRNLDLKVQPSWRRSKALDNFRRRIPQVYEGVFLDDPSREKIDLADLKSYLTAEEDQTCSGRCNDIKLVRGQVRAYASNHLRAEDEPEPDNRRFITPEKMLKLLQHTFARERDADVMAVLKRAIVFVFGKHALYLRLPTKPQTVSSIALLRTTFTYMSWPTTTSISSVTSKSAPPEKAKTLMWRCSESRRWCRKLSWAWRTWVKRGMWSTAMRSWSIISSLRSRLLLSAGCQIRLPHCRPLQHSPVFREAGQQRDASEKADKCLDLRLSDPWNHAPRHLRLLLWNSQMSLRLQMPCLAVRVPHEADTMVDSPGDEMDIQADADEEAAREMHNWARVYHQVSGNGPWSDFDTYETIVSHLSSVRGGRLQP